MKLTDQERDVILAALRLWQSTSGYDISSELWQIATNGGQRAPLGDEGIDDLCERLNQ
jgi:hypothetical protein